VGGNYGTRGVMLMNADGSAKRLILASQGGRLSWSPDGKWLTTTNCIPRVDGATVTSCDTQQLFAYRTDGSDLFNGLDPSRQITHNGPLVGPIEPQFSPDGGRILFLRADAAGEDPYLINRDGSGQHEVFLTPDPDPCTNTFMPFCNPAPSWGLYVPPAVGGGPSPTVRPRQATVPNVRALRYRTAKTRLAAVRLHAKVTHRRYSSRIKRGRVISQFPHARARASLKKKRSRVVKLVLSRGKRPKAKKH
jgi:Tol biopolymer transport system component